MRRRWVETLVALVALAALGLVLYNATLVDRRPPTVSRISLSATAGDDHVAQTLAAIDLEFSEPVDRASVERRFQIEPHVGGTFTWDRDTVAIFTPAPEASRPTPSSASRSRPGSATERATWLPARPGRSPSGRSVLRS